MRVGGFVPEQTGALGLALGDRTCSNVRNFAGRVAAVYLGWEFLVQSSYVVLVASIAFASASSESSAGTFEFELDLRELALVAYPAYPACP